MTFPHPMNRGIETWKHEHKWCNEYWLCLVNSLFFIFGFFFRQNTFSVCQGHHAADWWRYLSIFGFVFFFFSFHNVLTVHEAKVLCLHFDVARGSWILVINIVVKQSTEGKEITPAHHWRRGKIKGTCIYIHIWAWRSFFFYVWRRQAALQSMAIEKPEAKTLSSWGSVGFTHLLYIKWIPFSLLLLLFL